MNTGTSQLIYSNAFDRWSLLTNRKLHQLELCDGVVALDLICTVRAFVTLSHSTGSRLGPFSNMLSIVKDPP